MKHHYVPAFYLKKWAIWKHQLCQYRRCDTGRVAVNRKFPDATGYQENLYRIDGLPEDLAHAVEQKFMHVVDTGASNVLDKMIATERDLSLNDKEISIWASFLLSLRVRNPEAVTSIKAGVLAIQQAADDRLKDKYEKLKGANEPATFEEYKAAQPAHILSERSMDFLKGLIDNVRVGPAIVQMHWRVIRIDPVASHTLLTSDRPIVLPRGLKYADSYIAIPINPTSLFVAANDYGIIRQLRRTRANDLVKMINTAVVSQARSYVWGANDSQLTFVQRRFGQWPDPPIVRPDAVQTIIRDTPVPLVDIDGNLI